MFSNMEIIEIIRQYDLRVGMIETSPSYYSMKTNLGIKKLNIWNDHNIVKEVYRYREMVVKAGFRKVDRFIRTKEGLPYIIQGNIGYSLSDDIKGVLPSLNNEKEVKILAKTIAKFQQALMRVIIDNEIELWSSNFYKGLKYLNKIEDIVKSKENKNEMDELLSNDLPTFKNEILQSIEMAKKVEKIAKKNNSIPTLCHGNLQLKSFVIDEFDECWVIDFSKPVVDVASYDLAKFIWKIYNDKTVNIKDIYKLLDYYQEVKPLKLEDKLWILTYLAYPHELWKFVYIYYSKAIQPKNIIDQYQRICEQQVNIGRLYQGLYDYFRI